VVSGLGDGMMFSQPGEKLGAGNPLKARIIITLRDEHCPACERAARNVTVCSRRAKPLMP
jgi:hypothetical protein